jgi:aryl-phospho-beta-D-glucosidase BglC (GH1 family)
MNLTADRASIAASFSVACLALLVGSCLTPPAARGIGKPSDVPGSPAVAPSLGDFTRTSPELLAKLRLGWNLGNSLDVPNGETAWGNPRATPELFAAVAKAGFALVRIPVTWAQHLGPPPSYVIDPDWLDRVEEVVGFARAAGLYSIINSHHEGGWLSLKDANGNTTEENNAVVRAQFVAVWSQIAKYFANQGEELMFESMNEVHDGYGKADPRHIKIVNDLNQAFVNLVRASGGNNSKRHLIIPGYNTNIDETLRGFKLPTDSAKNRLILSVHCYDPYLYALMGQTHTWGRASPGRDDWGQEDYIVAQFDKLKSRYVDQGVPVLIGEYGAVQQDGYEDYRRYYMEYVTKAAVDRGLVPVYWDNGGGGSGGESFALIDRNNHGVLHPKVMEAMLRAATSSYSLKDIALPAPAK